MGPYVWQGSSLAPALTPPEEPCKTFSWRRRFSVKSRGAGAILEKPQIAAPPKRLWLLQRSPSGGAVANTLYIIINVSKL